MKKNALLVWGFSIYAVSTLVSMATMSLGVGILLICLLIYFQGPKGLFLQIRTDLSEKEINVFFGLSRFLTIACLMSLVIAYYNPLTYVGKFSQVHFLKDMAKAWYL